jgi:hypothetical protein
VYGGNSARVMLMSGGISGDPVSNLPERATAFLR